MTIRIYNTLTKSKQPFLPEEKNKVRFYVCGITPYDRPHLGHARCYVVFDVIHRYLEYKGYDVFYVQNFTDIDDKIINRSSVSGVPIKELVDSNIKMFLDNMKSLNVAPADSYPRVTENIDVIIDYIITLINKGFAYEAEGSVYFSVKKFSDYGKLSGRNFDEADKKARVAAEPGKQEPFDFTLWKKSKENEPFWESPWGRGRPGWHIECSAMAYKILGPEIEIHGGGQDLIFPHHENEIAQSESFTGRRFVKYWVHNGFITINREKMSKSLGNITSIDDILKIYPPMAMRLFLLNQHYRSPIDFSAELLDQANASYIHIRRNLYDIHFCIGTGKAAETVDDKAFLGEINKALTEFTDSLDDDFNTAKALASLHKAITLLNRVNTGHKKLSSKTLDEIFNRILRLFGVLGVTFDFDSGGIDGEVQRLIDERQSARKARDFKTADNIRQKLIEKGIVLEDTPDGVRWKRSNGS